MKFTVTLDIEVDMVAWGDEYGVRGARDIKSNVLSYVRSAVDQSYAGEEDLLSVEEARISEKRRSTS